MARQYITTAIDYPNAAPHMGHVLEKVLADVCARWMRLQGDEVRFQVGTDEHGVKIQRTAEKEGITPKELVDRNTPLFRDLFDRLQISYDDFVCTTDKEHHWPTVIALWKRLQEAGVLQKRSYTGLYCSGCERFMTRRDLVDGMCENHKIAPEEVMEENWFFLLSRDTSWLKALLKDRKNGYVLEPEFRAAETLSLIEQGLEDVSFSRPKKSLSWGIPVPGDEEQTMYVWCDALTNYISTLGYFTDHEDKNFWENAKVMHVIGKDIARFHALCWPAMLKNAGLPVPPPQKLLIHGFLTNEGQKMSKSLGNVVKPEDVIKHYGVDPLRFYLLHEVPVGRDGDFSWDRFGKLYDAKLRNDIGNLLNRVLVLFQKENGVLVDFGKPDFITMKYDMYKKAMDAFDCSVALHEAVQIAVDSNRYIDEKKPWELKGKEKANVLSQLAEALRYLSLTLLPFIPETAQKISRQLNVPYAERMLQRDFVIGDLKAWGVCIDWKTVGKPEILFPQVE